MSEFAAVMISFLLALSLGPASLARVTTSRGTRDALAGENKTGLRASGVGAEGGKPRRGRPRQELLRPAQAPDDLADHDILFKNAEGAPVTVTAATARAVPWDEPRFRPSSEHRCEIAVSVGLLNNTGKGIARILVLFTDVNGRERARLVSWADAGPHSPFAVGYDGQGQPEVLQSSARPYELSAVVSEVLFEDGFVWDMEHPRGLMDVDTEPELLERPHAQYTENALQKRIQGPVRMRLLLSADGTVKEVKVMCPLPDGLDESATREAYGLRFKPATKNGKPVECLLVFEIEFVLPTRRRGPGNPN